MVTRKYGWKPDVPDHRDHLFKVSAPMALPPSVNLQRWCGPVEDQKALGSCTANSIAGLLQYDRIKEGKADQSLPSRLFIYWNERHMEGTVGSDSGAMIRDGIKSLHRWGFCDESLWPYSDDTTSAHPPFIQKPPAAAFAAAKREIVTNYARVPQTAVGIKTCLALGFPVVFGFSVYESFESPEVAKTGIVPMPGPNEQMLGGHAVMCCGYDDATQHFLVRNSWGPGWGQAGYFQLPYQFMLNPNLADDFWTVRFVP